MIPPDTQQGGGASLPYLLGFAFTCLLYWYKSTDKGRARRRRRGAEKQQRRERRAEKEGRAEGRAEKEGRAALWLYLYSCTSKASCFSAEEEG